MSIRNINLKAAEERTTAITTDTFIARLGDLFQLNKKELQKAIDNKEDLYLVIAKMTKIPREKVKKVAHGLMYQTGTLGEKNGR